MSEGVECVDQERVLFRYGDSRLWIEVGVEFSLQSRSRKREIFFFYTVCT